MTWYMLHTHGRLQGLTTWLYVEVKTSPVKQLYTSNNNYL